MSSNAAYAPSPAARPGRNFLSLAGAEVAGKLVTFAAFAYLARVIGPGGFGYIELAGAALLCASLVVDQGFGPYGAREIAKLPQRTPTLTAEIIAARSALAVAAYLGLVAFTLVLDRPPIVARLILIYGASVFAMPWLLQWVFQGHDRMQTVAVAQVIRQTVFSALVLGLVRDATQIWLVGVAEVAAVCSAAAYTVVVYRRHFGRIRRLRLHWSPHLLREGVPIGLSQMFWVVRMSGATLLLGFIASAQDLGFFSSALRMLLAAHAFIWLYYFNLLPAWARAWQRGETSLAAAINRSVPLMAWVGVGVSVVWVALAPIVTTVVYGAAFAPAILTLQWLAGVWAVAGLSGHYRFGLIAAGRQTVEMLSGALGAAIAVLAVPAGYAGAGVSGAAIGLLTAEIAVWLTTWWCGRQILALRGHAALLFRPLFAAALAAGCLSVLSQSSVFGRLAATLAVVAVAAVTLDDPIRHQLRDRTAVLRRLIWSRLGTRLAAGPWR